MTAKLADLTANSADKTADKADRTVNLLTKKNAFIDAIAIPTDKTAQLAYNKANNS